MEPLDHFSPSNTKALVDEAIRVFKAGHFQDAYNSSRKVTELTPEDVDAHMLLALSASQLNDPKEVIINAFNAFKCPPKYTDKHDQFGGSHKAIAELIERTYETAVAYQQFPTDTPLPFLIYGIACQTLGEFDKAREAYDQSMGRPLKKFFVMCYLDALERAKGSRANREKVFDFENHIFSRNLCQQDNSERLHDLHVQLYNDVRRAHSLKQEIHPEAPYAKWVTGDLANFPNESFQEVKTIFAAEVNNIITSLIPEPGHPFLGCIPKSYRLEIFGALLGPGGYHSPHIHSGAWLSGGYYVQVPDLGDPEEDDHAACIEFGRCFLGDPDNFETNVKFIQPQEGMLLMWPSYYMHNTVPCQSQRERLTIGINIYPN